jgi:hypothetical protein
MERMIKDTKKSIKCFGGAQNKKLTKEEAIKILIKMAVEAEFDYILLIDNSYFINLGISTSLDMSNEIINAFQEATKYQSVLVIFDLDSIADLTQEFKGLSGIEGIQYASLKAFDRDQEKPSFDYVINRIEAFRAALECFSEKIRPDKNHWIAAISNNTKLTLDLKLKSGWPQTELVKWHERIAEEEKKEKQCKVCGKCFSDRENDFNACTVHTSKELYNEKELDHLIKIIEEENKRNIEEKKKFGLQLPKLVNAAQEAWSKLPRTPSILVKSDRKDIADLRWVCCKKDFFSPGECSARHIPV